MKRKRHHLVDEVKPMSSPSSSDHLEYIKELGFKDSHSLVAASLLPIFMEYRAPKYALSYRKMERLKAKGMKPPEEPTSNSGDNIDCG